MARSEEAKGNPWVTVSRNGVSVTTQLINSDVKETLDGAVICRALAVTLSVDEAGRLGLDAFLNKAVPGKRKAVVQRNVRITGGIAKGYWRSGYASCDLSRAWEFATPLDTTTVVEVAAP